MDRRPERHVDMAAPLAGGLPRLVLQDVGIVGFFCARKPGLTCVYNKASGNTTSFIAFASRNGQRREIANFDGWPVWALSQTVRNLRLLAKRIKGE
jgi:hypothetical protein